MGPTRHPGHAPPRVLVIDDDPIILKAASRLLEKLGCSPEARHPDVLTDADLTYAWDLILCDVVMPGRYGVDVAEEIQRSGSRTPVMLMSGDVEVDDLVAAMRVGVVDFLKKPISRLELSRALGRLSLDGAKSSEATPVGGAPAQPTGGGPEEGPDRSLAGAKQGLLSQIDSGELGIGISPRVLQRVAELITATDPEHEEVVGLIESVPRLGAATLRLAQSAAFMGRQPPASTREAIARLGTIRALATAAMEAQRAAYSFEAPLLNKFASQLWLSHAVTAALVGELAERLGLPEPGRAVTETLFAFMGELAVIWAAKSQGWAPLDSEGAPTDTYKALVREGAAETSAHLMRAWALPETMAALAAEVHAPETVDPRARLVRHARRTVAAALKLDLFGAYGAQPASDYAYEGLPGKEVIGLLRRAADTVRASLH